MLTESFLAPYRAKVDPFDNLLARSVYYSSYRRGEETWTDTIQRIVEGNIAHDPNVEASEATALFDTFWTMKALPGGRGIRTGGVDVPIAARYNCFATQLERIEDWQWLAMCLMAGGGVGLSLVAIDKLPDVKDSMCRLNILCNKSHPNVDEFHVDDPRTGLGFVSVEDSREGWCDALFAVIKHAFLGESITLNVSSVRPRGTQIKRFGGIAPGPGPLVSMLRSVWGVIRKSAVRGRMSTVDCLDVTCFIGQCIKSGGVRRSALIIFSDVDDRPFTEAKRDFSAISSHRSNSNNSIIFAREEQFASFDWRQYMDDVDEFGEPGFVNMYKIHQQDPDVVALNPCFRADTLIRTSEGDFRIDELVGKQIDVWDGQSWRNVSTFGVTSENERMLKITMQDGSSFAVTRYHAIVLADGTRVEAKDLEVDARLMISNAPEAHGNNDVLAARALGYEGAFDTGLPSNAFSWTRSSKIDLLNGIFESGWRELRSENAAYLLDIQNLLKTVSVQSFVRNNVLTIGIDGEHNRVVKIEDAGVDEKVYCLVTDDPDKIALTNGLIVGRCGEILLHKREACCLSEMFPSRWESTDNAQAIAELTTRYTIRQRLQEMEDPESDAVRQKNMRIGVSISGWTDFDWTVESNAALYNDVVSSGTDYAHELGVNVPIAFTTVKPSGSISLLASVSPGVHAPYSPFYKRRIRIMKSEPMAVSLRNAGLPEEDCVYDTTRHTSVFTFPMKAPKGAKSFVSTEGAIDQMNRVRAVQDSWTDNSVSATITFRPDEKDAIAEYLKENAIHFKCLSFLPFRNGYAQAPYEEISADEYADLVATVDMSYQLDGSGKGIDVSECESGVCPI